MAVDAGEVGDEAREVGRGRTPPAVDRLHGIPDGGDRQGGVGAAEEAGQQHPLGVRGVLVLVEHDDAEAAALAVADLGVRGGEPGGEGHLLAEGDDVATGEFGAQLPDEREQREPHQLPVPDLRGILRELLLLPGPRRQFVEEADEGVGLLRDACGVDHVVVHVGGERQQGVDDVGAPGLHGQLTAVGADEVPGDLEELGAGDQPGGRLHGEQQAVFADEPTGVGVVGGHGRGDCPEIVLEDTCGVEVAEARDPGEGRQPGADALGELLGGFPGEREAEDLVGGGESRGDEPHHAGGHGLGLARAGAGDDEEGAGVGADDGGLLIGGGVFLAEPPGQQHRGEFLSGHR